MEDVMNMMEENDEGNMEFPRDVMLEDCFSGAEEPLYGFVSNVTIPEEMLEPCLVGIECDENGNRLDNDNGDIEDIDNEDIFDSSARQDKSLAQDRGSPGKRLKV